MTKLCELGRNARLRHVENLLQVSDGEFFAHQEREKPEAGWVREDLKQVPGSVHDYKLAKKTVVRKIRRGSLRFRDSNGQENKDIAEAKGTLGIRVDAIKRWISLRKSAVRLGRNGCDEEGEAK